MINNPRIETDREHWRGLRLATWVLALVTTLSACVTVPQYTPDLNPQPSRAWFYLLDMEPPLPVDQVRVEVMYQATNADCPTPDVATEVPLETQGQNLRFTVYLDRFQDGRCQWRLNQLWIGLHKDSGYATRFSIPPGGGDQTRWCRLNPQHGVCLAREQDILDYQVPGEVHRVTLIQQ